MGNSAIYAVAWSIITALIGFFWARAAYNRYSVR
jgi:hypothetical protein